VPCGTSAIVSPVAGFSISAVPPSAASTHLPLTKFWYCATAMLTAKTSSSVFETISLSRAGGCSSGRRDARLLGQALGDVDGNRGEQDDEHGDDVHDRELIGPRQVREDPQRKRLLVACGEVRDDDLVEREREREQPAGEQRRADRRQRDVEERLPRVCAQVHGSLLDRPRGAAQPGDDVVVDDDDA